MALCSLALAGAPPAHAAPEGDGPAAAPASPDAAAGSAPAAPTTEERLLRLEAELRRTQAELESLRRERAMAPPATATALTAPATSTGTATPVVVTATLHPAVPGEGGQALLGFPEEPPSGSMTVGPVTLELGLGKGFELSLPDDAFSIQLRARMQVRFTETLPEDDDLSSATGFQVRRARIAIRGHAVSKVLTYNVQLGFSNQDTERDVESPLRDAWVNWAPLRDVQVRLGQMKVPFSRQRQVSSSSMQFPDRSIVQSELNLDRDVGLYVHSPDLGGMNGLLSYWVGVFGGDGRNRVSTAPGALFVGRVQLAPFGKFDDLVEGDIERLDRPRLAIAAALAWNENTQRARSTFGNVFRAGAVDTYDAWHLEADVHVKWAGFSLISEVLYRDCSEARISGVVGNAVVSEPTRSSWGWFAQAGYMLTDHIEVAARHGDLFTLGSLVPFETQRETGGGASYYVFGHNLKLQADYSYLWGDRLALGTHEVRVQLQLFF